jgi:hypothetical protein
LNYIKNSKDLEISDFLEDGEIDRSIDYKVDRSHFTRSQSGLSWFDRLSLARSTFLRLMNFDRSIIKLIDITALVNSSTNRNNIEL